MRALSRQDFMASVGLDPDTDARLIRFLISEGIVPRPEGATRGATYDERHIAAFRRYQALSAAGLSLRAIREVLSHPGAVAVLPLRDGATVTLPAAVIAAGLSSEAAEALVQSLSAALRPFITPPKE